ncbi:MAG: ATP-binding protein [Bacteroidales bacterium]|nr:ATP-binding protein [Bacteroidales bacterium]
MLYRKFASYIEHFLLSEKQKILLVNGARQIGKSYLIRYVGKKLFKNFIEIDLREDSEGKRLFSSVSSTEEFYMQIGALYGNRLGKKEDTLIFLDEIQAYPQILTMLKFLNQEGQYTYIASGSQLGVALSQTTSVPMGSIAIEEMYPLDFEEFLIAMDCSEDTIAAIRDKFTKQESLNNAMHNFMLQQFKLYLLIGGLPEAINKFLENRNITSVRRIHKEIHSLYRIDASQYDIDKRLTIRKIYDLIPSQMENRKKRIIFKNIEKSNGHKEFKDYADEFEYLTDSGIALSVNAISNPRFPLLQSQSKNLLKLYLNDVGLLSYLLYGTNINSILKDEKSINLGSIYETAVAQNLKAHGFRLYYYDNKQRGEVDFIIDDYTTLSVLPIEVKSGKDYYKHSALNNFLKTPDYNIARAVVFSNEQQVYANNRILYMPVYYSMFYKNILTADSDEIIIPKI